MNFDGGVRDEDGYSVLRAAGELDLGTAPGFGQALRGVIERGRDVVVDLSDVTFIDSTGLSAVLEGVHTARQAGTRAAVVATDDRVVRLFALTGADTVVPVTDSVRAAASNFLRGRPSL